MRLWKKGTGLALSVLAAMLLTGCMFKASFDELYEVPQMPPEYTALRDQIEAILSDGAEYAPPTAGTNIQSVQLTDLDGDGVEEALAFFRKSSDEKPLKIYIFRAVDNTYEQATLIEGSGTSISSVSYVDLDGDGVREVIVGWRVGTEAEGSVYLKAVSVYSIRELEPKLLMEGLYNQYEVLDFDADGDQEIVLLRSDTEGEPIAEYYDWAGSQLRLHSAARLSMTMAELERMDTGCLRDGETALFITGAAEDARAITDILIYKQDAITNIVRNDITGASSEIFRYVALKPTDIDGDGVTEVPMPVVLPSSSELNEEDFWQIYWRNYNSKGQGETVASTYHNTSDGWYLMLPESWDGEIAIRQVYASGERGVIFSACTVDPDDPARMVYQDVLGIYTITGSGREVKATRSNRFVLQQQVETVYAAAFLDGNEDWPYAISQEELTQRFRLIVREWAASEN